MTLKYFPTLLLCVSLSLAALAAGMVVEGPLKWPLVGGAILPLVYYHVGFLRQRVRMSADTAAIDSVYYYGFLVTVAALALSALSVDTTPPINFQPVLTKFGVGLAATGYAVLARMHLMSLVRSTDSASVDEMNHEYVRRSQALIDDVEVAIVRVKTFSETVLRESHDLHAKTKSQFDEHLLGSARAFQGELTQICSASREAIVGIRELVNDVAFVSERSELNKLVTETASTSRKLTEQMDGFAIQITASAEKALQANAAIAALEQSLQDLDSSVMKVAGPQGALLTAATGLAATTDASTKAAQSARDALTATADLTKTIGANDEAFAALLSFAKTASAQFQGLAITAASLDTALLQLSQATSTADSLARELTAAGTAFPRLGGEADALTASLGELKTSVSSSARELEADVQRSVQATQMLIDSLAQVAEQIVQRTRVHQGLAS